MELKFRFGLHVITTIISLFIQIKMIKHISLARRWLRGLNVFLTPEKDAILEKGKELRINYYQLNDRQIDDLHYSDQWHRMVIFLVTLIANMIVHELHSFFRPQTTPDTSLFVVSVISLVIMILPILRILRDIGLIPIETRISIILFFVAYIISFFVMEIPSKYLDVNVNESFSKLEVWMNEILEKKGRKFEFSYTYIKFLISAVCGLLTTVSLYPAINSNKLYQNEFKNELKALRIKGILMQTSILHSLLPLVTYFPQIWFYFFPYHDLQFLSVNLRIVFLILSSFLSILSLRNQTQFHLQRSFLYIKVALENKWKSNEDPLLKILMKRSISINTFIITFILNAACSPFILLTFSLILKNQSGFTFNLPYLFFSSPSPPFDPSPLSNFLFSLFSFFCFWFLFSYSFLSIFYFYLQKIRDLPTISSKEKNSVNLKYLKKK